MPYIIVVFILVILGISTPFITSKIKAETTSLPILPIETEKIPEAPTTDTSQKDDDTEGDEMDGATEVDGIDNEKKDTYDDNPSPSDIEERAEAVQPTPSEPTAVPSTYADGTYQTSKTYRTPDGMYTMNVGVTLKNDTITNTTLSFDGKAARDGYSKRFSNAYQSGLIGNDLEKVSPSRISGASLTTDALNNALSTIRSQAS